jgi:hypothetical protein
MNLKLTGLKNLWFYSNKVGNYMEKSCNLFLKKKKKAASFRMLSMASNTGFNNGRGG